MDALAVVVTVDALAVVVTVDALAVVVTVDALAVVVTVAVAYQSQVSVFDRWLEETHSQDKVVLPRKWKTGSVRQIVSSGQIDRLAEDNGKSTGQSEQRGSNGRDYSSCTPNQSYIKK